MAPAMYFQNIILIKVQILWSHIGKQPCLSFHHICLTLVDRDILVSLANIFGKQIAGVPVK